MRIELTAPTLFGNEAAEDEQEAIFYSYALERPELTSFSDESRPLAVVRAYKGEGKSALLRLAKRRAQQASKAALVLSTTSAELAPEFAADDYEACTIAWKAAIIQTFAREVGSVLGVAWNADAMSLARESECAGYRPRPLPIAIAERLGINAVGIGQVKLRTASVGDKKTPIEGSLRRVLGDRPLWLFVDDVDKNFVDSQLTSTRVASFFDAIRSLVKTFPGLRVRTAVRPNVWSVIKRQFESLSHVEQYMTTLSWEIDESRRLLAKRIDAYIQRSSGKVGEQLTDHDPNNSQDEATISAAFETPVQWGGPGPHPVASVLHTLSMHRPRWLIELAKVAAASAVRQRRQKITLEDIKGELMAFGRRRIDDTVAEYRSQCPDLGEIISAFQRESEQLTTDQLFIIINNKVLNHMSPRIAGGREKASATQVASLLYQVGLIFGRRESTAGNYEHISFSENPQLLSSRANLDAGLSWEIHPVYRQALEIRDAHGVERRRASGVRRKPWPTFTE